MCRGRGNPAHEIVSRMGDWAHSRLSRIARADLDRMWNIYSAGETGGANEVMLELAALTDDPARHLQVRQGEYVAVGRRWSACDRVDISMPLTFRTERAPDDPAVQSVFYDPTLMVSLGGAAPPIVWRGYGFYRHHTLDGDFSGAFTATATPMHFTSQGHVFAPLYVADPNAFTAYHAYFERAEPEIVFGSENSGVPNRDRGDGWRFLDLVWQHAPFASHGLFVTQVEDLSRQWQREGRLTHEERIAVLAAAVTAHRDLEP